MTPPLVRVRDLSVRYRTRDSMAYAVDQVSLEIERGQVLALVGESGAGKTTVGMAMLKLLPDEADVLAGEIQFDGHDLLTMKESELRAIRGRQITMIFQDPIAGLNPVLNIGDQVAEVMTTHLGVSKNAAKAQAIEILAQVGLPDPRRVAKSYPFQLSGGMCQRVMIGIATAMKPDLIVADEPTASLDVTAQAQILHQLDQLRREQGTAILLITHDLGVVSQLADEVGVMYAGHLVETGTALEVLKAPHHPYAAGLLDGVGRELLALPGNPPSMEQPATHCPFIPRCPKALQKCRELAAPQLTPVGDREGRGGGLLQPDLAGLASTHSRKSAIDRSSRRGRVHSGGSPARGLSASPALPLGQSAPASS